MAETAPRRGALSAGDRVSRYEVLELLGESFSGSVYKALDPALERRVALRLIPFGLAEETERRQCLRNVEAACLLEHPNVCPVYEAGEDGGHVVVVTAYCEGESLAERLLRGPARPESASELAAQIASAVAQAHGRGLLHGRLRPTNVRVGTDGQAKVVDFGLSSLEERTCGDSWRDPVAARLHGYLAPEVLAGSPLSPRSDVWAIGAILLAMLTGQPPSQGPPSQQGPGGGDGAEAWEGVPADLMPLLVRALAHRPSDRHSGAGELRDELRALRSSGARPAFQEAPLGRRLSRYRVGDLLGGGGMGVVYKAEDVQLGRTVALKFLPPELASDPKAKARFHQEARAASSLDHPNICTVYEIGETEERQLYIAMPCYNGETLKARISRGPLPVAEALEHALQIARGLAKAHRQGIVHRDIKPANLMLTSDGLIKILDFGIAKLAGEVGLTRAGSAVGTPAYMSPERIRCGDIDGRTDLWSLGVVLYEMLTGQRPFSGDDREVVAFSILAGRATPLAQLRPDVSPELAAAVHKLLAPDPEERPATAEDVIAGLHLLREPTASGARPAASPRTLSGVWVAAAALGLLIAAAGFWPGVRSRNPKPEATRQPAITQLTDRGGREMFPSLSPDGNFFVYAKLDGGDTDLFLQRAGGGNAINLTKGSPWDETHPAYSPDGRWIAFRSERDGGGLFLMGATGESVRRITDRGYQPAWSPDGREIAFATAPVSDPTVRTTTSQIWRIDVATGRQHLVAQGGAVQPSWSPGGHRIAYWGGFGDGNSRKALWTVPASGGRPIPLLEERYNNWGPAWAPGGDHLYFISDRSGSMNLWSVPVEERRGLIKGEPEPVTIPARFVSHFSLSQDGRRILYATEEGSGSIEKIELDASGRPASPLLPVFDIQKKILAAAPSPDGAWIALYSQAPQEDLYIMRADGSGLRQLTDDPYHDRGPRWSPDGRWIYYYTDRNGRYEIWGIRPDGSDAHAVAVRKSGELFHPVPSPDGRWLLYRDFSGSGMVDISRPPAERVFIPLQPRGVGDHVFVARSWSSDMKWLTGTLHPRNTMVRDGMGVYSPESGKFEKLPGDGLWPTFLGDDRTVVYLDKGTIYGLNRKSRASWVIAQPPEGSVFRYFSLGLGGRLLYAVRLASDGDVWLMDSRMRKE